MPFVAPFFLKYAVWRLRCVAFVVCAAVPVCMAQPVRIHVEDNHAGSFAFFAENADLESPHRLLLIDAHCDANGVKYSDDLREGVRRVANLAQRHERLADWRREGRIQAYNWIEPLMPAPVAEVYWMPPPALVAAAGAESLQKDAADYLDGRAELDERSGPELGGRFRVVRSWEELPAAGDMPWLATIDLDSFVSSADPVAELRAAWSRVLALHDLRAVSICVSRPWQPDDARAFALLEEALRLALATHPAHVSFEPLMPEGPDASLQAESFAKLGKPVPRLEMKKAPASLLALLRAERAQYDVAERREEWDALLEEQADAPLELGVQGRLRSPDGVWRLDRGAEAALQAEGAFGADARVTWFRLEPEREVANLVPSMASGRYFSGGTFRAAVWHARQVAQTDDPLLASAVWRQGAGAGRSWWKVRAEQDGRVWESPVVCVAVTEGEGFHAGLAEQLGTPYMFGAGMERERGLAVAESGYGNDCANYMAYAWRRAGKAVPWSNPEQLKACMEPLGLQLEPGSRVAVSAEDVRRGVVYHAGNHVSALWEDRPPLGSFGAEDVLVHHLSGFPELLTRAEFERKYPRAGYGLWTLKRESRPMRVAAFGDISPAGDDARWAELAAAAGRGDLVVGNLEGSVEAAAGEVPPKRPFSFRAKPGALAPLLRQAGLHVVSLANNHAEDGGASGALRAKEELERAGIGCVGIGRSREEAVQPWIGVRRGKSFAVWGIAHDEAMNAPLPGVHAARLPQDAGLLLGSMRMWRRHVDYCMVLVHWGRENTEKLSEAQHVWSRWLAAAGADVVFGSHPHVLQAPDTVGGCIVFPSLGNARFEARGPVPGFSARGYGEVELRGRGDHTWRFVPLPAGGKARPAAGNGAADKSASG